MIANMDCSLNENMTFGQLDDFANEWILRTKDMEDRFAIQADALNNSQLEVLKNLTHTKNIHEKLNMMNHLQHMIDKMLFLVNLNRVELLENVQDLEKKMSMRHGKRVVRDDFRDEIYSQTVTVNDTINSINEDLEDTTLIILESDKKANDNPAELIARILMRQLYNLEGIEMSIYSMTDQLKKIQDKYATSPLKYIHEFKNFM